MGSLTVTVADKITSAKLWLTSAPLGARGKTASGPRGPEAPRDLPYLEAALHRLLQVASNEVSTMSVDQHWRLYVSEQWVLSVTVPEIGAELAHLLWHLLREHSERATSCRVDTSTAMRWHRAADAALFGTLDRDGLAPEHIPSPLMEDLPEGQSAEDYFALLTEQNLEVELLIAQVESEARDSGAGCGSGCDGLTRSWDLPLGGDVGDVDGDDAREIRRTVAIAYQRHITERGTEPGDAWRWSQDVLEPTIVWDPLLRKAVRKAATWTHGHTYPTYRRPSRRQSAVPNFLLPGTRRPVPRVAVIVDTSGSVDDVLLAKALGEVEGVLRTIGVADRDLTVLACDAAVHTVSRIRRAKDAALAGGGGTDLRVGIVAAMDLRPRPQAVIIFTDGFTPWPEQAPEGVAVVVALLARQGDALPDPPPRWATTIVCRL